MTNVWTKIHCQDSRYRLVLENCRDPRHQPICTWPAALDRQGAVYSMSWVPLILYHPGRCVRPDRPNVSYQAGCSGQAPALAALLAGCASQAGKDPDPPPAAETLAHRHPLLVAVADLTFSASIVDDCGFCSGSVGGHLELFSTPTGGERRHCQQWFDSRLLRGGDGRFRDGESARRDCARRA